MTPGEILARIDEFVARKRDRLRANTPGGPTSFQKICRPIPGSTPPPTANSDNKKFCNDLNGPKTPKMSERPLKTLQYFETSNLVVLPSERSMFGRLGW